MKYAVLGTLMISALLASPASAQQTRKGGDHSGGGDLSALKKFAHLVDSDPHAYWLRVFEEVGQNGLARLEAYAWTQSSELTPNVLRKARAILNQLVASGDRNRFIVDDKLVDPATGKPRAAQNAPGATFWINPAEFGSALDERYGPARAERVRESIVVHELLSQPEIALETTGDFSYSSVLLDEGRLTEAQQAHAQALKLAFGQEDPTEFYACDATIYAVEGEKRTRRLWRSPVPLRTYLRWSLGPGHMDTAPNGAAVLVNPNFVPGTASVCLTIAMDTLGLAPPLMVNNRALDLLYRDSEGFAYDICGVMGDSIGSYSGAVRYVLRKVDPNRWNEFNYVTTEKRIEGKGTSSVRYGNLELEMSCGRFSELGVD